MSDYIKCFITRGNNLFDEENNLVVFNNLITKINEKIV